MHCLKLLLLSFLTLAAMSQFSVAQPRPLDSQHQITKPRDEAQTMSLADSQSPDSNPSEQTTAATQRPSARRSVLQQSQCVNDGQEFSNVDGSFSHGADVKQIDIGFQIQPLAFERPWAAFANGVDGDGRHFYADLRSAATPLVFEIEAAEPITISKDQVEKADAYERYLKELREWNLDALKAAEALQNEGEPRVVLDVTRFQSWRRKIGIRARHGSQHKQLIQHLREDDPNVSISNYDPPKNTLGRGAIQWKHPTKTLQLPKSVLDKMRPAPISVAPPLPTEAPLQLKFTNVSDRTIQVGGLYLDCCKINLSISGDRAFKLPITQLVKTADYRVSWVLLEPGETHTIKLKRLRFGDRGVEGYCLRRPGRHNISVEYSSDDVSAGPDTVPISVTASTTVEVSLEKDPPSATPSAAPLSE